MSLEPLEDRRLLSYTPEFITDGWSGQAASSNPHSYTRSGDYTYFVAAGSSSSEFFGEELWRTDGTAGGTQMVIDMGFRSASSSPRFPSDVNGTLYFTASPNGSSTQLWKTDGTLEGTVRITDSQGNALFTNHYLIEMNGVYYFAGSTTDSNFELWRTDGTAAGTWQVKDVRPGSGTGLNVPAAAKIDNFFHVAGDTLYFVGDDGIHGRELWKSDGTEAGTVMVKDIDVAGNVFVWIDGPSYATINGVTYFAGGDNTTRTELWRTDGTETGTYLVKDIIPGATPSYPKHFTALGERLYFVAEDVFGIDRLWTSDGTEAGTHAITTDIGEIDKLVVLGDRLYFSGYQSGYRLWQSDGTAAGTSMVSAIGVPPQPALIPLSLSPPSTSAAGPIDNFAILNGKLYFSGGNASTGVFSLYEFTPGTAGANRVVPATPSFVPPVSMASLTAIGDRLYFSARAASVSGETAIEPWMSNGTTEGTVLLKDLTGANASSVPVSLGNIDGRLIYAARSSQVSNVNYRQELWLTEGSSSTSQKILTFPAGVSFIMPVGSAAGQVFFQVEGSGGSMLWRTDGTPEGTAPVKSVRAASALPTANYPYRGEAVQLDGLLYFLADDGVHGYELWRSDGTANGTHMVTDLNGGVANITASGAVGLTRLGDSLLFSVTDGPTRGLWRSDGTAAGTSLLREFTGAAPGHLTVMGEAVYFSASGTGEGVALWKSDGTPAGTALVTSWGSASGVVAGAAISYYQRFAVLDGEVYFAANDGLSGVELWKSDGTEAGTALVSDILPGAGAGLGAVGFPNTVASGDSVYFIASDTGHYRSLWKTDGTAGGTGAIAERWRASSFTASASLEAIAVDGVLYFSALGPAGSTNVVWRTNGTTSGTSVVLFTTPPSGPAASFSRVGDTAYFIAAHLWAGTELFALAPDEAAVAGGDYNDDGLVTGHDFLTWQQAVGTRDAFVDGDRSGVVDGADLGVWLEGFVGPAVDETSIAAQSHDEAADAAMNELYAAGDFTGLFAVDESTLKKPRWRRR